MSQCILLAAIIFSSVVQPGNSPRKVLLFAADEGTLLKQQLQLLRKDSVGLRERDIEVSVVPPGDRLYEQFAVLSAQPFTFILIGRDGGEKFRSSKITSTTQLFALVDAMPMRKQEMRRQKNRKP